MERSLLLIAAIIFVVGAVGFLTVADQISLTGNVVKEQTPAYCNSCAGTPVCAGVSGKAITFPNACEAACQGAVVLAEYPCDQIPANPSR
jgi:hypothetical protein